MVRHVVREQQSMGKIECQGRGPGTLWTRLKQTNGSNSLPLKEGNGKDNNDEVKDEPSPAAKLPSRHNP